MRDSKYCIRADEGKSTANEVSEVEGTAGLAVVGTAGFEVAGTAGLTVVDTKTDGVDEAIKLS